MAQTVSLNSTLFEIMDAAEGENYYTDLELAAAIGKNLLERNKELELFLCSTQEYADEQAQKSQYLTRQLEDAKEINESRVKLMEQIEKNHEQLSRSHSKLERETKSIREHNEALTESLQTLVEKCDQYKTELESLKRENTQLQKKLSSTQISVEPSVENVENEFQTSEKVESENKIEDLSVVVKELKFEQDLEKSMREELENELSQLIIENQNLEQKLRLFAKGNRTSYAEEQKDETKSDKEDEVVYSKKMAEIEVDEECSSESYVIVEEQEILELDSEPSSEQCDISFLDELDQQYRELVGKYNALVEKCKSEGVPYESREMCTVQRGVQTSHEESVGSEEELGCGQDVGSGEELPQYKRMFAQLYQKIRDGRNES